MFTTLDFLYIALTVAIIITAVFINMILYNVWRTIRTFRISSEKALNVTTNILNLQRKAKLAVLKPLHSLLSKISGK